MYGLWKLSTYCNWIIEIKTIMKVTSEGSWGPSATAANPALEKEVGQIYWTLIGLNDEKSKIKQKLYSLMEELRSEEYRNHWSKTTVKGLEDSINKLHLNT